ncbi:esterase/lipase family protein [Aliiglaciecola litoralis]|uniref:Acetyltransferase n=1 Tax=Aliiglaciecola litoralis TaxID=582857 RepID=A0ABP3WTZ1_9ALTE
MNILFVHGMGRTPMSGVPMLWRLKRHGHNVDVVGYLAATESFQDIVERVKSKLVDVASRGHYVVIGHSLGGILLRVALQQLPSIPRPPEHLFLLGSPVSSPRLANKSKRELGFQWFSGDCGKLLSSSKRMNTIKMPQIEITSIVGNRGFPLTKKYFLDDPNDGVVSVDECYHQDIDEVIELNVIHTFLPSSRKVSHLLLSKISQIQTSLNAQ